MVPTPTAPACSTTTPSALTKKNLDQHNAAARYDLAAAAYDLCLQQGISTRDGLRQAAYAQQWESLERSAAQRGSASNDTTEAVEDLLEYFGLLSVADVDVALFTQPVSDLTPLGRFLADIPSGINRRLYDLGNQHS